MLNIMNRAVRWECGCVGFSFGWHNGVYEHVLLEACDSEDRGQELLFVSRPSLSDKKYTPLDQFEQDQLKERIRAVFRSASLMRSLRSTLAEALDKSL